MSHTCALMHTHADKSLIYQLLLSIYSVAGCVLGIGGKQYIVWDTELMGLLSCC